MILKLNIILYIFHHTEDTNLEIIYYRGIQSKMISLVIVLALCSLFICIWFGTLLLFAGLIMVKEKH